MKRIICLILAMILCLAVFTSCAQIEDILGNLGFGGDVTDEGVDKAHTFLSEMYKDLGGTHVEDFDSLLWHLIMQKKNYIQHDQVGLIPDML